MRRLTVGALVVVLALLGLVGHTAWSIGAYSSQSTLLSADAAIVLGAAAWGDEPSPVFRERINHAIELYRQGYVRKLIFTGASGQPGEPPESLVARQYALQCGVPEGDILVEVSSHITEQSLYQAQQVGLANGLSRFLLVSDPLHMKRAMRVASDLGMEAFPSPTPTSRYQSWRSQLGFLARETLFYLAYLAYRAMRAGAAALAALARG